MKWSWRIGTVAGISVYVHATFTLLIAWVLMAHILNGDTLAGAAGGLAFVMAIFACVLLHEVGHALAARRYGIGTRDITLLPIGGVARLERIPEKPLQELWVALAGPAVNVLIAAVLWLWLVLGNQLVPLGQLGIATGPFVERLLVVNLALIVFNMIPAFPMDGGRVLRALLALRLPYARATRIAASIGQVLAAGFVVLGLFTNPFLLLVGAFVWLGAAQEAANAQARAAMRGFCVGDAMLREFHPLAPADTVRTCLALAWSRGQRHFVVCEGPRVVGTVSTEELASAVAENRGDTPIGDVMRRRSDVVDAETPLGDAFAKLGQTPAGVLPVVRDGELVGFLTLDGVLEFVRFAAALGRGHGRSEGDVFSTRGHAARAQCTARPALRRAAPVTA
jgi:Zn-dependent protease/predicted transcriptional regulator